MIKIVEVDLISNISKEAIIYLSDGKNTFGCFYHPYESLINAEKFEILYTLNCKNLISLNENIVSVENVKGKFEHLVKGEILDKEKGIIKVGEFLIELDNYLLDEMNCGDFVSFCADRIDIY